MALALQSGSTLLHYRVVAPLGAGGMGEVYRALDTTLGREVAIKVLPTAFASDGERLARFEREARLLASLNHPNIAAVYGLHELAGNRFLAMELAPGETLAERLARGRLAVDEALEIARQIADALAAAHDQGVVHRDLKPGNVQVTGDGKVKVLDFGLAKGLEAAGAADLALSPTLTFGATVEGVILGTAAYMSPEQARGRVVDRRADVWAFGCVLWEMLVGRQLFGGETVSDTIASLLRGEIDWEALPEATPAAVRRLLRRCLERDPAKRLRDLGDARLDLDEPAMIEATASPRAATPPAAAPPASQGLPWAVAGVALLIAIGALAWAVTRSPAARPSAPHRPLRFAVADPAFAVASPGNSPRIAIAPAGDRFFWVTETDGVRRLATRSLGSLDEQVVKGSEGIQGIAAVAADGESVAIVRAEAIEWLALRGGAPSRHAATPVFRGAALADDGALWLSTSTEGGILRAGREGGELETLVAPDAAAGERSFRWPVLLPGDEVVLFTVATAKLESFAEARIEAYSTRTRARTIVVEKASYPLFLAPDRLFFVRSGGLFEATLDVRKLALVGPPRLVQEGVGDDPLAGMADVALARDGTLLYLPGGPRTLPRRLVEVRRDGTSREIAASAPYQWLRASPDGKSIAVDIDAAGAQVWLVERDRGTRVRLTDAWSNNSPIWLRDGAAVVYGSGRGARFHLFEQGLDGGAPRSLLESESRMLPLDVSPDGARLLFLSSGAGEAALSELPLDGAGPPRQLQSARQFEAGARYSPDGRWLAFVADESGEAEIYLSPLPGPGRKLRVTTTGGKFPLWSHDGRELFFVGGERGDELYAVSLDLGIEPTVSRPQRLVELDAPVFTLDIFPDGAFVAALEPTTTEAAPPLVVARGWDAAPSP